VTSPVVERSVAIATIASRELVLKDFALEGNDEKMRKAAHLMVQSLSGSLAAVSTREPLRVSIIAHIKNLLLQNGFTEQSVPEQAIYVVVADNLELACSIMEKTAAEKSTGEVDDALSQAYLVRRKHREVYCLMT
jgi:CCR4-NOT transcription complex subunit 1